MTSLEDGSTEIVEVVVAALAVVPLSSRLGLVMPMSTNLLAAAVRAAHGIRPPDVANSLKAFGIIDQSVDLDEQFITLAFRDHGLSFRVRVAQHKYRKAI